MIIGYDGSLMVGTITSSTCGCGFYSCSSTLVLYSPTWTCIQMRVVVHTPIWNDWWKDKISLSFPAGGAKGLQKHGTRTKKSMQQNEKKKLFNWNWKFQSFFWLIEISATFSTGMKMKCWTRNSVWKVKRNHFSISAQLREKEVNKWIELNHFGFCVCECECV